MHRRVEVIVGLILVSHVVWGSPFMQVNQLLSSRSSNSLVLRKSTLPGKEIGVFTGSQGISAFVPTLKITHEDWIDPYGMLELKGSDLVDGTVQKQVFMELLVGRKGNPPLLQALRQSKWYIRCDTEGIC